MTTTELAAPALWRRYDPASVGFGDTREAEDVGTIVGQPRAAEALDFALGMGRPRYHVFVHGAIGTGKHTLVLQQLHRRAATRAVAGDLCYVHNFDDPRRPRVLELPAGAAESLSRGVEHLIEDVRTALATAFESEEYQQRRHAVENDVRQRQAKALEEVSARAQAAGLAVIQTPAGLMVAAVRDGQVLAGDAFEALPAAERARLQGLIDTVQEDIERTMRQIPRWLHERRDRLQALRAEVARRAAGPLMEEMRGRYASLPAVLRHLDAMQQDIIDRAEEFRETESVAPDALLEGLQRAFAGPPSMRRYRINVLVSHEGETGAPIVLEDNPTHDNLIGHVEHGAQFGTLVTDFTLIRGGALHRANTGYLVLEAHKLLRAPFAWDALKRALQTGRLRIESPVQALGLAGTVSLEPEPVPLDVQVVLVGEPLLYHLLSAVDPEFGELFKVNADFDDEIDASEENQRLYARLIATLVRREGLRPFDRSAVARVLEYSARLAGHQQKLSARIGIILDLLRETDYWAAQAGAETAQSAHVQQAIDAQIHRSDRLRQRVHEEIERRTLMIDTDGVKVGQVNGLSLASLGNVVFGRPTRITARVRMGRGDVVDIEREVALGGPVHSKGVLILAAYVGARYLPDRPLALSASLVFEQSYAAVEGDSASAAELFALLSSIANVPLKQALAVTGSVNQHGDVQPVGNVNEKIEGFFDVCRARGLSGEHGVIIPAVNAQHLMLRHDVVDSVAAGRFHVYAIHTMDEGLALLTGREAGERDATGAYPEGSVNRLVEDRLWELAEKLQEFSGARPGAFLES
ncbi:MAG TPA: ATP-binding protein [Gemmatimonadales bacterium]